ncbi:MAG: transposase family protein [Bryobacterales bacterium]|nr:transposase family protein [Bryobacterales bacterium]
MMERKVLSLEEIQAFLDASEELEFEGKNRQEVYDWVRRILVGQQYHAMGKVGRGLVRSFIVKLTGLSRAQMTRLIGQYLETGNIAEKVYRRRRFPSVYTRADIVLLAEVDEAHETLSGPATQKILYREYHEYGNREYERLAKISVAHIYNLRRNGMYRKRRVVYQKTKPVSVSIGERRKPDPKGRPGYLRVDTVHQGDLEGTKGVYHITAVDEVTQWQVMGATAQISEAYLLPVLEAMLEQFPFAIRGFHSDNGSEFINERVAMLLQKLLVEQTKSRPRRSNDNGLVESKNGAVVRKHMGYGYIAAEHAERINEFYREQFNVYLNFHRPCGVPEVTRNKKGKERRVYRWYATPWEILRQLPDLARQLKEGLTVEGLNEAAGRMSDTAAARRMQEAKRKLFASWNRRRSA